MKATADAEGEAEKLRARPEGSRRQRPEQGVGVSNAAGVSRTLQPGAEVRLLEAIVSRENMMAALERVVANKGAAGVDGMTVDELKPNLREYWPRIREELLAGRYTPSPVRGVEIPKPGVGVRGLGIPTVVDRLIQQAMHQVLMPLFDPDFSDSSYGFWPGRSAHQAVLAAQKHVASGRRWVVDMDLEKFFDRVNHDVLMARVERRVTDRRVLQLIRSYLRAGLMLGGVATARSEGTPQGGPLSPLLSNILLDDLDRELERRGHAFCRYADDCNVYVQTRRSGERVMASLSRFPSERLKLTVNAAKSAVDRPWKRTFLGYSMTVHQQPRLRVAAKSVKRLCERLKEILRRGRGQSLAQLVENLAPILRGWIAYFRLAQAKGIFEELDGWMRRKLRCILWRQWKRPPTRERRLMHRGIDATRAWESANNGRGPWWNAGASHMSEAYRNSFFDQLGLIRLQGQHRRLHHAS